MKYGIFSWFGIRLSFGHRIAAIKRAGFDTTSVWIDTEGHLETDPEDVPRIVRDAGLELEYAHAPYSRINSIWDEKTSGEMGRELEGCVDYCERHRIPVLVTHLTKGYRIREANDCGLETVAHIVAYARERNVRLAAENTKHDRVVESVLDAIIDPALGLCFDTSHDNLYGEPRFGLMERYPGRILCFHLSDNDGKADDHWPPLQGAVDWEGFAGKFPGAYSGALHLEILPREKPADADVFLREALESLRALERKIDLYRKRAEDGRSGGI